MQQINLITINLFKGERSSLKQKKMKSKLVITLFAMMFAGAAYSQQANNAPQGNNATNNQATTTPARVNTNAETLKNMGTSSTSTTPAPAVERHNTNQELLNAPASRPVTPVAPAAERHNTNADPR